ITRADLFQRPGEKTPVFVRFSTVAGSKGSADLARDVRGFAVKLYTKQGNRDLVGNNIPVFFIQDAIKFPDIIHAAKEEPDRGFPQAQSAHDNFWDFISLTPEAMHMVGAGLRLKEMPEPAKAARPILEDLKPSPALSILKNGPKSFAGRKVGALVTDGVDAKILSALAREL